MNIEQKKKIRLSDIAEKLGISTVTVSKALANKDGVGDDLRNQIKKLAEEMGYKIKKNDTDSDDSATRNIGILIPQHFYSNNTSFYWLLFTYLSKELLSLNYYSIMETLSKNDEEQLVLPQTLQNQKVDGLIILGQVSDDYLDAIHSHYDNFILLDFYTKNMLLDSISSDDYYCSYMLTNYVISQGHKKIRFVGNFNSTSSIKDRFMGFQKAMQENNLPVDIKEIISDRDKDGISTSVALPSKENMPTAFVCNSDETAVRVYDALTEAGYSVPEDISLTGFDNFIASKKLPFELTTVYIKPEDTAHATADLIIKKITGQAYIKGRHMVAGNILIRDSVKKI